MKRSRIELLELAKAAKIASCHKLKKGKIVELLFTDAAVHIQRIARKRAMYRPINTVDPISQCDLGRSPFLLISPTKIVTGFDANMLRKYIESTHHAVNPITQDTINAIELHRLQKRTGGEKIIVNETKKEERESQMSLSLALQRDIGDAVQELLDGIENEIDNGNLPDLGAIFDLIPELLPRIISYATFDEEGCRHILDHCIDKIRACQTIYYEDLHMLVYMLTRVKREFLPKQE